MPTGSGLTRLHRTVVRPHRRTDEKDLQWLCPRSRPNSVKPPSRRRRPPAGSAPRSRTA
ncbi:hypothetical protein NOCARDAX2BIS_300013 [Nocardioides sp. AX2bis]|nr:hypothetical protein NOCARDAX2BIS_300013 [Nocardioides sp. AX2bis]